MFSTIRRFGTGQICIILPRQGVGILCLSMSTVISSSSSSPSNVEEGSSRTCVGAVPRDLSLYDIMSRIRWLLLHSNTVIFSL